MMRGVLATDATSIGCSSRVTTFFTGGAWVLTGVVTSAGAVVGSSAGPCFDRAGAPISTVRISVRAAGDSLATQDFRCGGRFDLGVGPGTYYLHAWVYTPDGATRLGYASIGPYELADDDLDVGTFVLTLF